jgi:hypothetical protein
VIHRVLLPVCCTLHRGAPIPATPPSLLQSQPPVLSAEKKRRKEREAWDEKKRNREER